MAYEISEIKKIGIGLVGFGILFSFLGVILFFDRGLLALGNIFFFKGVGLLLGWQSLLQLFTKKANIKGSVPFFLGLFLLFVRWPVAVVMGLLFKPSYIRFQSLDGFCSIPFSCLGWGVSELDGLWWEEINVSPWEK
ncbi:unnamed protein product [Alopecurus aequalis]